MNCCEQFKPQEREMNKLFPRTKAYYTPSPAYLEGGGLGSVGGLLGDYPFLAKPKVLQENGP